MNQTKMINLPIIGMVQHGQQEPTQNGGKKAKELGHFIAKIQDDYMQKFLQKFDEQFKGKQFIEIEFCDDNPLSKKFIRYNQGGKVCQCLEGQTSGLQKVKNGWQPIECNTNECQHRQMNEYGKVACNRIGWLKFLIPSVCQDRIWLMKITGQKSINRLDAYIQVQKMLGNSLKGRYILFLRQEEQTSKTTGQTYNNYNLDILKKEDFNLINQIPQENKKISTNCEQNVNENVVIEKKAQVTNTSNLAGSSVNAENINETKVTESKPKESTKKTTKSRTKKTENAKEIKTETFEKTGEFSNHYVLDSTFKEQITNKKGETKEYVIGKFYDTNDQICEIVIKPEDADELIKCELGTLVEIDIKDVAERKFAINLKFISKLTKKVVA